METNNGRSFSILPTGYEDDRSILDKIHLSTKAIEQNRKIFLDILPKRAGWAICLDEILDDRGINTVKAVILQELKNAYALTCENDMGMYEKYVFLRDEKGCKDCDVSRETGIPQSTFTDWKNKRSNPKIEKIKKIADFFGKPIEYFLE